MRPTQPAHPTALPPPRLRLLGNPAIGDPETEPSAPRYRKGEALVFFLAIEGGNHRRRDLARWLWPALSAARALQNLRVILHALRRTLGDHLEASAETLSLSRDFAQASDLHAFRRWSRHEADLGSASAAAEVSHHLLRGLTLPDVSDFERWLDEARAAFAEEAADAWTRAANAATAMGSAGLAITWLRRATDATPWDEARQRQLIALLARHEAPGAATTQYQRFEDALLEHLDREPSPATRALLAVPASTHTADLPFIGREHECRQGIAALRNPGTRYLSVVGPPGAGTSRVAQAIAEQTAAELAVGVLRVPLQRVRNLAVLRQRVHLDLGAAAASEGAPPLAASLAATKGLLLLDDVDPALPLAEELIDLIATNPNLKAIIASRTRLELAHEATLRLGPLATEATGGESPAVALLLASAHHHDVGFDARGVDHARLSQLCRRLAGHPLALILAGARLATLGLAGLGLAGLEGDADGLVPLLEQQERDLHVRHRSLVSAIEATAEQLVEPVRRLALALATFATPAAAEAVAAVADQPLAMVRQRLAEAVIAGVAYRVATVADDHYQAVPGLREALSRATPIDGLRARHAAHLAANLKRAASDIAGPTAAATLSWYRDHLDDIDHAIAHLAAHDPLQAVAVAAGNWRLEARAGRALSLRRDIADPQRIARSQLSLAPLDALRGEPESAAERLQEATRLALAR